MRTFADDCCSDVMSIAPSMANILCVKMNSCKLHGVDVFKIDPSYADVNREVRASAKIKKN